MRPNQSDGMRIARHGIEGDFAFERFVAQGLFYAALFRTAADHRFR